MLEFYRGCKIFHFHIWRQALRDAIVMLSLVVVATIIIGCSMEMVPYFLQFLSFYQ